MARPRKTERPGAGWRSASRPKRAAPAYLGRMHAAVRGRFTRATDLSTFLGGAGTLTREERTLIVQQALILIEQNYAHLPLKRAMHSIDPVQRLRLLLQAIELSPPESQPSEAEFHREVLDVFVSLRDLHTNYLLPEPFAGMTAFLPFMVEDYVDRRKRRRYIVSHVVQGFQHATFVKGVEVLYWNGVPIDRAVLNNAQRYAGSNRAARHARGVQTLTTRALRTSLPPDEEWVVVGFRGHRGGMEEIKVEWIVNPPTPGGGAAPDAGRTRMSLAAVRGIDLEQHLVQQIRKGLFAPKVLEEGKQARAKQKRGTLGALESVMPAVFEAKEVRRRGGPYGYIRIRTFDVPPEQFVPEFVRLLAALPERGLILDVRGNGGGFITSGEQLLQLFTPRRIEPEPVQFLNTSLNLRICEAHGASSKWADLSRWTESMKQALQTGATFSAGFPISDVEECNRIGQRYFGPVVLITDALCYSTTDIFAAGFQDHEIGPVLGTDENTGAGGANVWDHRFFSEVVLAGPGSPYVPLPKGAGMRVSMRRTLRVGRRAGTPVEDLGVTPTKRQPLTKRDLLEGNEDLITAATELLAARKARTLRVTVRRPRGSSERIVRMVTKRMTRLDVYLDDRPLKSVAVPRRGGTATVRVAGRSSAVLEIRGFDGKEAAARYRTSLAGD